MNLKEEKIRYSSIVHISGFQPQDLNSLKMKIVDIINQSLHELKIEKLCKSVMRSS